MLFFIFVLMFYSLFDLNSLGCGLTDSDFTWNLTIVLLWLDSDSTNLDLDLDLDLDTGCQGPDEEIDFTLLAKRRIH